MSNIEVTIRATTKTSPSLPKAALSMNPTRDQIQNVPRSPSPTQKTASPLGSPSSPSRNKDGDPKKEKKAQKVKKGILSRRRTTKSKGFHSLRRNPSPSVPDINTAMPKTEDIFKTLESPDRPKKKIILFRVRLQDDNHKTMTIEQTTTAAEMCEKLSNKLRKERPEQSWDGCELFETTNDEEIPVDGDRILSEHLEVQYLFKRQGEKLANAEEELQQIIQQRKRLHAARNEILCNAWFGHSPEEFPMEDQEHLNILLDILALLVDKQVNIDIDTSTTPPHNIAQQIETLEESVNQARKKLQNARKVRKKPGRLLVDNSHVSVLRKIADAGGSYASIYCVSVNGMECAMKELVLDGVADTSPFLTEIAVLEALPPHQNLVQYVF